MAAGPRVVLDTNTVLSALVFSRGRLGVLREAWQHARCQPLVSRVTVAELVRVLTYPKFRLDPEQQRELLGDYVTHGSVIRMPARLPRTPVCRDPSDVPFLQLALVAKADFLVTGDGDLLALAARFARPIVTPDQFLKRIEP